ATMQALKEGFENPELVEFLTFDHLNEFLSFEGVDKIEEEYQNFVATSQKVPLVNKLKANYEKWAHLKSGMPAPDFTYPDIDSLVHSLSDFKGQYVYIDVWATWCGPCLAEQPYLEKIEAEYADNENILFMGVSIDADKAAWKKMVTEKEMYGVQLIAEDAWNSKINQDYLIKGIPRFILVDPEGNLVSSNAHRPSSDALKEQLEELLDLKPVTG
ncbi:MAG: TlpA disulfide reductase family protein, partial [Bacteroidota bacterium]